MATLTLVHKRRFYEARLPHLLFIDGLVNASAECTYEKDRGYGRSVRLVKDVVVK